jgi:hypothetical protein
MLDVQCSMFDVHFLVSFPISLAALQANGWAET